MVIKTLDKLLFAATAVILVSSCSFMHDDRVVAKVGGKKLYASQVNLFIPAGATQADSAALARSYINAWAGELILNEMAQKQLSKNEKDVSAELEEYKNSLLKYRYEQHYIQERLDTSVTEEEILQHYEQATENYILSRPIVKARYIKLPPMSPIRENVLEMMERGAEEDIAELDSLSKSVASSFTVHSDKWIDIVMLAKEFGMDYGSLLAAMDKSYIIISDEQGNDNIAYIWDFMGGGKTAPLEFCKDKIRETIVSKRKYTLSSNLEKDLLENALKNGDFVIFENENDKNDKAL